MKNTALTALFLAVLLAACPNPADNSSNNNNDDNPPEQKTTVVFDNTRGVCAVAVYDDHQRREADKIAEIPAGSSSAEIAWTPSNSYPFYFTYLVTLAGISDIVIPYVPAVGKDQTAVRIDENKKTIIPVPALAEALESADELLSGDSYLVIQNLSSYSFQLLKSNTPLRPDNSPDSAVVNSGEKAVYKIVPGTALVYALRAGVNTFGLESFGNFEAGHIYRLYFDGAAAGLIAETEIKPENIPPPDGETIPEAPGLPSATAGDGLITLWWLGVKDAETYEVYLSTSGIPPDKPSKTVPGHTTVTVITGLTNKSAYTIWIKAANGYGASEFSPPVRRTPWPALETPQTPTGLTVISGNGRLTLTWEPAAGADSYDVYISSSTTRPASPHTTTAETNALIDGLTNNSNYYVWVRARNSNGPSDYSQIETGRPQQPTTPPAAPGAPDLSPGSGELTVIWRPVEMAEAYEVWAGTSDSSVDASKRGGDISGGITQTTITGLANETTYYVWVKAKNARGTSGFSPRASAKPSTFAATPAAPSSAPLVSAGNGRLTVSWTAVEGALSYEVWIANVNNSAAASQQGGDISGGITQTVITGLNNGTACYVWVKAKNSSGVSGFSPAASGTPLGTPAAPAANPGNNQLTVSWDAVAGASAYEVWIATVNDSAAASKNGGDISGALAKTISGLVNGTTYYVWIRAKNSGGVSGFSPAASGTPSNAAYASISIGFNYNEVTINGSDGVNGISKTGAAGRPQNLSLSAATGYTAVVWYVDGDTAQGIPGSGTGITLAAAAYPVQTHSVTFTGKWNGVLYSRIIPFTVYD